MVTEMVTGSLCFPLFLDISPYGRWLREVFVFLSFSQFLPLRMVAGDGYGKSLGDGCGRWLREVFVFLFFLDISPFRGMVTGDGYGRWLREVFVFLFFLIFFPVGDGYGKYGYGKSLGDGYGKSLFSFFFLIFLLFGNDYGRWLWEMVTGRNSLFSSFS